MMAIALGAAALRGGRYLLVFLVGCGAAQGPDSSQAALARAPETFRPARGQWDEAVAASEDALQAAAVEDGIPAGCGRRRHLADLRLPATGAYNLRRGAWSWTAPAS